MSICQTQMGPQSQSVHHVSRLDLYRAEHGTHRTICSYRKFELRPRQKQSSDCGRFGVQLLNQTSYVSLTMLTLELFFEEHGIAPHTEAKHKEHQADKGKQFPVNPVPIRCCTNGI